MEFKIIKNTPLWQVFSDLGKRIFLPDGIFYWSGRAKKEADLIGTIGSAFGVEKDFMEGGTEEWVPCYLGALKDFVNLNIKSVVPYAPIGGLAELRSVWKDWIITKSNNEQRFKKLKKLLSQPLVSQGITNGIFIVCSIFLNPGEQIISPNKRWGNYDNIIVKNIGGRIKSFEFFKNQKINIEGLKDAIEEVAQSQDKVVIIVNFPNNPTGYVPTPEETQSIVKTLKESQASIQKPIVVIVDDAYEPYVYSDGVQQRSVFYDLFELKEDIIPIKLDGISKELLAYGGRVGFITFGLKQKWVTNDEELENLKNELNNKLEGINRSTISNTNHFYQAATLRMFQEQGTDKIIRAREKVQQMLKLRYERINQELEKVENSLISVDPNAGGFFLFINLDPTKIKANEFGDYLLKTYKVGVIPIEKPAENINGLRIAYCSIDLKNIPEFIERINKALKTF
ncbi:MAG: aminotransferase class I/II-fold pyridoxal phosphate-dependent enzyme [Promethearchaeota archaeon]